jgi:phenylalanyl-tRNA synthetase beta chain
MRLPLNWLKEFVDCPLAPEELADRLTLVGFEVEALEPINPDFSGVVVGRAARVDPHPNADRLTVVEVEDGRRTYQVVCGAPDVTAGRLYAFAPPGATISEGRELKAVKLRGVLSEGMLLAEDELGVSSDHTTLMAIPQDLSPGAGPGRGPSLRRRGPGSGRHPQPAGLPERPGPGPGGGGPVSAPAAPGDRLSRGR